MLTRWDRHLADLHLSRVFRDVFLPENQRSSNRGEFFPAFFSNIVVLEACVYLKTQLKKIKKPAGQTFHSACEKRSEHNTRNAM